MNAVCETLPTARFLTRACRWQMSCLIIAGYMLKRGNAMLVNIGMAWIRWNSRNCSMIHHSDVRLKNFFFTKSASPVVAQMEKHHCDPQPTL